MKTKIWRAANLLMLLLFLFSVVVQYNDPDPLLWVAIYALAALACLQELVWRDQPLILPAVVGAITLIWAISLLPGVVGKVRIADLFAEFEMKGDLAIEVAREAGGLLIVAVWMQAIVIKRMLDRRHSSPSSRADITRDVRG
ncbi:MAG: transmembrane 220 family protein [Gemmatimonadota bacterium]